MAATIAITCNGKEIVETHSLPAWPDRLIFDERVLPGMRIVRGTRLSAESLLLELSLGRGDADLIRAHPELSQEDVAAVRDYGLLPKGFRISFGALAAEAEDLDRFVEETYRLRQSGALC